MADARRLLELGMVPILAKELAAQITAGVGDKRRLLELTMVPRLASEVATQINTATPDKRRLVELGMVPRLALEVFTQIQGGGIPPGFTGTTYKGVPVTYNGAAVFDDGKNFYYQKVA